MSVDHTTPCYGPPRAVVDADAILAALPTWDKPVRHEHLFEDALDMTIHFFPHWSRSDLDLYQCKDGITNKLVRVTHKPSNTPILIRAYGKKSEVIIDRHQEMINMIAISGEGLCPPLYGKFANGLVYGYIEGRPFTVEDMRNPALGKWVAESLARWHRVVTPGPREAKLFPTLHRWIAEVPKEYKDARKQAIFVKSIDITQLHSELASLQTSLEALESPVVFAHNDLLSGNLILQKDGVSFIDYEYGCYNYRGFDIANHFAEWAGFECDYSHYPGKETQRNWVRHYLAETRSLFRGMHAGVKDADVEDITVDLLVREVNHFLLASHFYWGLWALIQAEVSDIDFDYMSYAALRFNEYFTHKRQHHL